MKCRNCESTFLDRRGLCVECYRNPKIRAKYPPLPRGWNATSDEPTEAELERTIAEQLPTLPDDNNRGETAESECDRFSPVWRLSFSKRWRGVGGLV